MRARLPPPPPCPPAELPLPQTSTLRSRRRLANILVTAGFIYMLCWLPHVCCLCLREFSINDGCSNTAKEFFMLLGELILSSPQRVDSKCFCVLSSNRIYAFGCLTDHSLDPELQFASSVGMPTLRQAQLGSEIPSVALEIHRAPSTASIEH